jgi:ADP-L-glycero-D-manno-heptose 6-epimerase
MKQVVITGSAGFIGSCAVGKLHNLGYNRIIGVDDFAVQKKLKNTDNKPYLVKIQRSDFFSWLNNNKLDVECIIHLGARTDTTETNWELLNQLNLKYSQQVWENCVSYQIPLIYASSAATYGAGEHGYDDRNDVIEHLKPLNLYGISKNEFDKWVLKQEKKPPFWAGLKFFNVYGPNEYHKRRMASVVYHSFNQIITSGKVKLFRSHRPDFTDGGQSRDFIYVKDVIDVIAFLLKTQKSSEIYNLGTGKSHSFLDLVYAVFKAMNKKENVEFIDTPIVIRDKYQYFTQATMEKLRNLGYDKPFTSLEDGVYDYVTNYLLKNENY